MGRGERVWRRCGEGEGEEWWKGVGRGRDGMRHKSILINTIPILSNLKLIENKIYLNSACSSFSLPQTVFGGFLHDQRRHLQVSVEVNLLHSTCVDHH
jgi:hypothetical protein